MGFRMPKKCRTYFRDITNSNKGRVDDKFNLLFDGYYLCLLVGLAQAKISMDADLEPEFVDSYPADYQNSRDYIAGLLVATERERLGIAPDNAAAIEQLMAALIDSQSRTRLTKDGEDLLNQYAARGMDVMIDKMAGKHISLEDFYQDYFECFNTNLFLKE